MKIREIRPSKHNLDTTVLNPFRQRWPHDNDYEAGETLQPGMTWRWNDGKVYMSPPPPGRGMLWKQHKKTNLNDPLG